MTDKRHPIPQMDEFEQSLREMAAREASTQKRPARWSRRRLVIIALALLALAAAAAGATQLISTGKPLPRPSNYAAIYTPDGRHRVLAVVAPDKNFRRSWGVAVFRSRGGQPCLLPGQVVGGQLGQFRSGVFRPYPDDAGGTCGVLKPYTVLVDQQPFPVKPPRTLISGRAGRDVARVRLTIGARSSVTRVGAGGAFLFVLDEPPGVQPHIYTLDRSGHVIARDNVKRPG